MSLLIEAPTSKISIDKIGSNQDLYDNFDLSQNQINTVMVYKEGAAYKSLTVSKIFNQKNLYSDFIIYFQYNSPQDKSGSIRARAVLLNPTKYFVTYDFEDINSKYTLTNDSVILEKYSVSVDDNTEFERGNIFILNPA